MIPEHSCFLFTLLLTVKLSYLLHSLIEAQSINISEFTVVLHLFHIFILFYAFNLTESLGEPADRVKLILIQVGLEGVHFVQ